MSVAARSPHHSNKRHFEHSSDSPDHYSSDRSSGHSNKRFRQYTSTSLRCSPLSERQPHVVSSSTLQALKGLFPDMDDKVRDFTGLSRSCNFAVTKVAEISPAVDYRRCPGCLWQRYRRCHQAVRAAAFDSTLRNSSDEHRRSSQSTNCLC